MVNKIVIRNILLYGLLFIILWQLVLFILSLIFQFDTDMPTSAGITFSILMGIISYFISTYVSKEDFKLSLIYSISWSIITFLAILIITIANDTTEIEFSKPTFILVFIVMGFVPLVKKILNIFRDN